MMVHMFICFLDMANQMIQVPIMLWLLHYTNRMLAIGTVAAKIKLASKVGWGL